MSVNPPAPYDPVFDEAGKAWNVNPWLLRAMQRTESGNRGSAATSKAGAQGLMQIMPATGQSLGVTDLRDPSQSIWGAAKLMRQNLDAANGDQILAMRMYHGGPDASQWGPANAAYAPTVMQHYGNIVAEQRQARASRAQPSSAPPSPSDAPAPTPEASASQEQGSASSAPPGRSFTASQLPVPSSPVDALSDDELTSRLLKGADEPPQPPQPMPTPIDTVSDDDLAKQLTKGGDQPAPPPPAQPSVLGRLYAGAKQGLVGDVGGTIARGIANVGQWVDDRVPALAALDGATGTDNNRIVANVDARNAAYQKDFGGDPVAFGGRVAGQVVGTAPMVASGNALLGAMGRVAGPGTEAFLTGQSRGLMAVPSLAVQGAAGGGIAAAATGEDPVQGAETGALLGPVLGGVGKVAGHAVNALMGRGPAAMGQDAAQLADLAVNRYGIPLRADQISASPIVKVAGDVVNRLPLSGGSQFTAGQLTAYNRAIANTFGEQADAITPQVMSRARDRIGQNFDHVYANTSVAPDSAFLNDLGGVESNARTELTSENAARISRQVTNVLDKVPQNGGPIPGDVWAAMIRRGTPLDNLIGDADPGVSRYAQQIKGALEDSVERSLPPGSPLLGELQTARSQWRSMRTIETLAAKAPTGDINPSLVMGRALANDPQMAYTGGGALGDLARIGQQFLKVPPNSGTADRMQSYNLLTGAAKAALGAAAGGSAYYYGGPGLAASVGGIVAARGAGALMRNPAYVNKLIQAGVNPQPQIGTAFGNNLTNLLVPGASLAAHLPQEQLSRQ